MPNPLQAIVQELLSQPAKSLNEMPRRIEMCHQALAQVRREENAKLWAALHNELAKSLAQNLQGSRADNLEQALAHFAQVLEVITRDAYPEEWATTQNNLAIAYGARIRGERADNLEQALAHSAQALEVYTRDAYPENWAWIQHNLSSAYRTRLRGDRVDNLERVIAHSAQALEVYTRDAYPEDWARIQHNLAAAYLTRFRGERADNLEQARVHAAQALEVRTRQAYPKEWARTQNNLALAYRSRIRGEQADNLERALAHAVQALEVFTRVTDPADWAMTQHNLACAYSERLCGERADNLEQALAHYKLALEVRTRDADPENWATAQINLVNSYRERLRGERADNLEQARVHAAQALEVFTRDDYPDRWATTQNSLAITFQQRLRGERADNLEQAIAHYQQALEVFTRDAYPEDWARTQNNMASAYSERLRGERADNLEQTFIHYALALEVRTLSRFPVGFQETQSNLGHLYFGQKEWADAYAAYHEAIRAEQVLLAGAYTEIGRQAEVARTAALYARTAYALLKLDRAGEALVQLEQGKTRLLSRALALNELDMGVLPVEQQDTLRSLRQTIRLLEAEMRLPPDTPARKDERTLADALEQARARLNETIETVRKSHPDFMSEGLTLAELLVLIPRNAVLVAPLVTSQGSAVFVVPAGAQSVTLDHVVWVADFKDGDLQTLLRGSTDEAEWGGWLGAYFNARTDAKAWVERIESTGKMLWERLMSPIAERLASLHAKHVLLMPQGGLGLLPLHAAWRDVNGTRRYFLDEYTVTYVPSAYARRVSQDRLHDAQRQASSLLAVVNPTEDLPFTPAEGEQVASLFGDNNSTVLPGNKATSDAVKQGAASYFHFACHGFYDWQDPLQSGLLLAKGEPFTLAQIIGTLNLEATRLVTLSACETGITDIRQSPDEYLGLPAGFLQAGAPAVVSTLWTVNDRSTMLLMERFYQLHLKDGLDIPNALRQAQIWLREVTVGELEQRFADEEDEALSVHTRMPIETASDYFTCFASLATSHDKTYQPFAHPYYWAAFTFSGA